MLKSTGFALTNTFTPPLISHFAHPALRVGCVLLALTGLLLAAACNPKLNWRDVQAGNSGFALLLPCKPDKGEKIVPLGGLPTSLSMLGCDAGGATFAVAVANLADTANLPEILAQWQNITLANMKATPASMQSRPLRVPGAAAEPAPVLVQAQGQRPDGSPVNGWAAYFRKGSQVVQVVMYASAIEASAAEIYFASLKFD
jgi:hypothetical protein